MALGDRWSLAAIQRAERGSCGLLAALAGYSDDDGAACAPPPPKGDASPSIGELRDLIAHLLAGVAGGTEAKWRKLVGDVEALPIIFHPRSNWRIEPTGTASELEAIGKAVTIVRGAHPYVPSPRSE